MEISILRSNTAAHPYQPRDWQDLARVLCSSNWSPATFASNYRSQVNFGQADVIGLDFDDGIVSLAQAVAMFAPYRHVIGTTRSHQVMKHKKVCDRFRVLLQLERPITSVADYAATYHSLAAVVPGLDMKCADGARLFYPCMQIVSVSPTGNTVPVTAAAPVASLQIELPAAIGRVGRLSLSTQQFLQSGAPPGGRNHALYKAARDFHQQNWLEHEATTQLLPAALQCGLDHTEATAAISSAYARAASHAPRVSTKITLVDDTDDDGDSGGTIRKPKEAAIYAVMQEALAEHALGEIYVVLSATNKTHRFAETSNGVLFPVPDDAVYLWFLGNFHHLDTAKARQLSDMYKADSVRVGRNVREDEVVPFFWGSEESEGRYAWSRLSFDHNISDIVELEHDVPHEYQMLVSRLTEPERLAVTLWLGSLLDYEFDRSQYLHLSGEGNDGKGSLIEMLAGVFGSAYTNMSAEDFRDAHGKEKLEGKRLVVFPDENNPRFISSGPFKNITGDNWITINPKHRSQRNIRANFRVLVSSNQKPKPENNSADRRRILPVRFPPFTGTIDPGFKKRLVASGPDIMRYCYSRFVDWHMANPGLLIPQPTAVWEDIVDDSYEDVDSYIDTHLVFESGARLPPVELQSHVKRCNRDDYFLKKVHERLKDRGITKVRPAAAASGEPRARVWSGVRLAHAYTIHN